MTPSIGIGLKSEHVADILATRPALGFLEIHAENYMGAGGAPHAALQAVAAHYPLSVHGVGLSIGGQSLDPAHLARLKAVVDRYRPALVSEHLAWSSHGAYLNDLLPLPYTPETLARVCRHIDRVQEALGRPILLENPSTYVTFADSTLSETDFLAEIVARTGCGLLLDVNNVMVSCTNHGADPWAYLADFPLQAVGEIHLGGHDAEEDAAGPLLIDAHGSLIAPEVLALYAHVAARCPVPVLIEWDNDVPPLAVLLSEVARVRGAVAQRAA